MQSQLNISKQKQEMIQAQEYIKEILGQFLCSLEDYANSIYNGGKNYHYQKYNNFYAGNNSNPIELRNRVISKLKSFRGSRDDYEKMFKEYYPYPKQFENKDLKNIESYLNIIKSDKDLCNYIKQVFSFNKNYGENSYFEEICIKQMKEYERSNGNNINPSPKVYGKYGPFISHNADLIGTGAAEKFRENPNYIPEIERDKPSYENIYNRNEEQFRKYDLESNFDAKRRPNQYDGYL
jgi:hypothetical protein